MTFRIPRLTDREVCEVLSKVAAVAASTRTVNGHACMEVFGNTEFINPDDADSVRLQRIFDADSQLCNSFEILDGGHCAFSVSRQWNEYFDTFSFHTDWSRSDKTARTAWAELFPEVMSVARKLLGAPKLDATLNPKAEALHSEHIANQNFILQSLQETAQRVITDAAAASAEQEKLRAERYQSLEQNLRAEIQAERSNLEAEFAAKVTALEEKEQAHAAREKEFETKEARYMARQGQKAQITQIEAWLKDWRLTKGTTSKRIPIVVAYGLGIVAALGYTIWTTQAGFSLFESADDIAKLAWWQWVAVTGKPLATLAVFTTLLIYYIRWEGQWAKQHAGEEFLNRTRLVDIGRAAWLLEAVRDAQENNSDIPPQLLSELSRNLFSNAPHLDADIHPVAVSDLVMQGLNSLKLKVPNQIEFEAQRGKGK